MNKHNAYLKEENLLTLFSLNNIIIPEIQREYVWGNNPDVLKKFLLEKRPARRAFTPQRADTSSASQTLFFTEHDPPFAQIVGTHFQRHAVTRQYADEVQTHTSADMGVDHMSIGKFHPEHSVGQKLPDSTFNFDYIVFGHVKISGSLSVIKIECSK